MIHACQYCGEEMARPSGPETVAFYCGSVFLRDGQCVCRDKDCCQREIARLREALAPFAQDEFSAAPDADHTGVLYRIGSAQLFFSDFRRARSALLRGIAT